MNEDGGPMPRPVFPYGIKLRPSVTKSGGNAGNSRKAVTVKPATLENLSLAGLRVSRTLPSAG